MEPINQISIESFSYGWLNNINPTFDFDRLGDSLRRSLEALDSGSFIEMDPDFFSMRWTDSARFDFNLPASSESSNPVHADQIFSNGKLLPKKKEASESNHWGDSVPINTSPIRSSYRESSTEKMLRKYLNFLVPLYKKVKKMKILSLRTTRSCGDSPMSSVRMKNEFSSVERNQAFDWEFESSIHDAVLHCKKSMADSNTEA